MSAGLVDALRAVVRRDVLLVMRRPGDLFNPLVFFLIVGALFPVAVGPDPAQLARIGPGVVWVAALLATLLALNGLFVSDHEDGSLEQLLVSEQPLPLLAFGKTIAHWLTSGLPLVLLSPLLGIGYRLPGEALGVLGLTLALGTFSLSLLGAVGAALTVGLSRGTALLSILVLPMSLPVLIFGARSVSLAAANDPWSAGVYFLAAYTVVMLVIAPYATAAALRISNE